MYCFVGGVMLCEVYWQVFDDVCWWVVYYYQVGSQEQGFVDVVGDQEEVFVGLFLQVQQEYLYVFVGQCVECVEWFVEQQEVWFDCQCVCQFEVLLLVVGELGDGLFGVFLEVYQLQDLVCLCVVFGFVQVMDVQVQGDVFEGVELGYQGVVLEYYVVFVVGFFECLVVDLYVFLVWFLEIGEDVQQC